MELKITRGEYLPHWAAADCFYHVCFHQKDSIPAEVLKKWQFDRENIISAAKLQKRELTEEEKREFAYLYSEKVSLYLDKGCGNCSLGNEKCASVVVESLEFYNKIKYELNSWCVMPNHVHIIIKLIADNDLFKIIHSWKSYSATVINQILNRKGRFWHPDAFNRLIRNQKELDNTIKYVWENPDKAGFNNWKYRYML